MGTNPLLRKFLITGFLIVITLIPTAKFVFTDSVPAPIDQIHTLPPWNRPMENDKPWDVLYADAALQVLPWRDLVLDSIRKGEVPLWNPYTLGGVPFLANSQSAPLYPLHWLWALLGFSAGRLLAFSSWLHLFIAAIGTYLLCRSLRCSRMGAFFAASAFSLSAFMVAWIPLSSVMMTASWIPWSMYALHRLYEKRRGRDVALLSISIGLMLLAGHLQIAVYGLLATSFFALWLLAFKRTEESGEKKLFLFHVLIGFVIGFLVASPQLLPVLENGRMGHRASPPTEEGYHGYASQSLDLHHLAVFIAPNLFGMPGEWFVSKDGDRLPAYWLALQEPGRHYAELAFYLGPSVLFFGLLACFRYWRKTEISFFVFLFLFAIAAALGTVITRAMYFWIPGWSATGSPGRIAVLCALSLSVLAGCCFRESTQSHSYHPDKSSKIATLSSAAIVLFLSIFVTLWEISLYEEINLHTFFQSLIFFEITGFAAILFAVLYFLPYRRFVNFIAPIAIALNVIVISYAHRSLLPVASETSFKEPFEGMEFLQSLQANRIAVVNERWTLFGPGNNAMAIPNSLLPYRIHQLDGYDSIIPRQRKMLLDSINGKDSAPLANGNMLFLKPGFDEKLLMNAGVTYVVSSIPLPYFVEFQGNGWDAYRVSENTMAPEVLQERMNSKLIRLPSEKPSTLLEAAIPGWWAKSGNSWESLTPKSELRGTVELLYLPGSYRLGFLGGMLGIFAIVALSYKR
ncbi:MAG TPA: hypothetical protein VNK96_09570 [Fimbriimonadales bacterium]|nr:hypothetical protein [Fimbriimonadales bacterium]